MLQAIAFFSYIIYCSIVVPPFFLFSSSIPPRSFLPLRHGAPMHVSSPSFSLPFPSLSRLFFQRAPPPRCFSSRCCENVPRNVQKAEGLNYDEYPFVPLHIFPSPPLSTFLSLPFSPFFSSFLLLSLLFRILFAVLSRFSYSCNLSSSSSPRAHGFYRVIAMEFASCCAARYGQLAECSLKH